MLKVILVVLVLRGAGYGEREYTYSMPDMATCLSSVAEAHTDISTGGDAEQGFAIFCAYED